MLKKLLVAATILTLPATALAHHGWSSYDDQKVLKVRAPLMDLKWGNPHGTAKVRYNNAVWDVILAPVSRMEARGLTKEMAGKTVELR